MKKGLIFVNPSEDRSKIYHEFYDKVTGYVKSRIKHKEDAEDIVSSVFLKVYSKLDTYDEKKASLSTWIYAITKNTVINYYKKQKDLILQLEDISILTNVADKDMGRFDEMLGDLNDELEKLPQVQSDIVILHYYFGLSHKEISKKMEISYPNVRKLCSVALAKLRDSLDNEKIGIN